jgi:hypothetical protein
VPAGAGIVEWFHAVAVAHEHETSGLPVVDGERKHPHQMIETPFSPFDEGMEHDLGVRL